VRKHAGIGRNVGDSENLSGSGKLHGVLSDDVAGADGVHAIGGKDDAGVITEELRQMQRGAGRRIALASMVRLDEIDVELTTQEAGGEERKMVEHGDAERQVRRDHNGDGSGQIVHVMEEFGGKAGGGNEERSAMIPGDHRRPTSAVTGGEINDDIAGCTCGIDRSVVVIAGKFGDGFEPGIAACQGANSATHAPPCAV